MEGDAADSQLVDEENGLTEEVQLGMVRPRAHWMIMPMEGRAIMRKRRWQYTSRNHCAMGRG